MMDITQKLENIADASMRIDGTDCPLGEQCREASSEIERLRAEVERLKPFEEELRKLATDLGEPDDPFAAWEAASALVLPPTPILDDKMAERAARAMIAQTEGITHGKFDLLSRDVQDMWLAMARVALRAGLADAHSKNPLIPGGR